MPNTGKDRVAQLERVRITGVAGRIDHVDTYSLNIDCIPFFYPHRDDIRSAFLAHDRHAIRPIPKRAHSGDVIGMRVRINDFYKFQIEFFQQPQVFAGMFVNRINNQRFSTRSARDQIGIRE